MKNQSILYTLVLLLVSGPGATAAVEYEGYTNPAGDAFPIAIYDNVAISSPAGVQILSDAEQKAYFDTIRMAGFNVELWGKEDIWRKEPINKWGPYLKSLGMNTIISTRGYSLSRSETPYDANTPDSILLQDNWNGLRTVISNYSQDPNVWGYWACDEPGPDNLHKPVYEMRPNQIAVLPTFNMVHKYKESKVPFANFVAVADKGTIGYFYTDDPNHPNPDIYIPNFENFLDYMVDELNLKFLTFDLYPVIHNEFSYGIGSRWVVKPFYYNMMDLYGRYCRDRKIPVWLTMLSVEHADYDTNGNLHWEYPEITDGILRLQAMNGLAFGMKGLLYWEYGVTGIKDENDNTWYKSALFDINKMATTPAWAAANRVNSDVAQYGSYLRHATYDRSCLAANINRLSGKTSTDTVPSFHKFAEFSDSFECVKSITYDGKGVLLSHLISETGDYLAVVNQDYANNQKLILVFDKTKRVKRIKIAYPVAINGIGTPEEFVPFTTTINLMPGEMALFKY